MTHAHAMAVTYKMQLQLSITNATSNIQIHNTLQKNTEAENSAFFHVKYLIEVLWERKVKGKRNVKQGGKVEKEENRRRLRFSCVCVVRARKINFAQSTFMK